MNYITSYNISKLMLICNKANLAYSKCNVITSDKLYLVDTFCTYFIAYRIDASDCHSYKNFTKHKFLNVRHGLIVTLEQII